MELIHLETATEGILETIAQARELTRAYYHCDYRDKTTRRAILEALLGGLGDDVTIDTPFHCDHGNNIFLGDHVRINLNCTFVDNAPIHIGNWVLIASNVQIYTSTHPLLPEERLIANPSLKSPTFFHTLAAPVTVGDRAWIGAGTILLPGVSIGEGTVIGAGSVVTRSIPANCVAVGNPCRIIRRLDADR